MPNLLELRETQFPTYQPTPKEQAWLQDIYQKFDDAEDQVEQSYAWLAYRTPQQYWRDQEKRWLALPYDDGYKQWWQSRATKPITRQKCIAIVSYIIDFYMQPDIKARGKNPARKLMAKGMQDMVEVANDRDKFLRKHIQLATDSIVYGTAYLQEDFVVEKNKIKDIERGEVLMDDGEVSWKEAERLIFEGPKSQIVSPFDLYLGDMFEPDIQKQPYLFRREVCHYKTAEAKFGNFDHWEYVQPGKTGMVEDEDETFKYHARVTDDLDDEEVEILYYQCRQDDEIAIVINGVPMTKMGTPIPYDHKKYNIVQVRYATFSNQIAIGKGLPDLLQHEQDNIDTLYRLMVDGQFLRMMPPLLARGREVITSDILQPASITTVDTETEIQPLITQQGVGNEFNVIGMLEGSMDKSSIDPSQTGAMASGQRSATQVLEAKYGTQKILGLFAYMIAFMIEDFTDLRLKNLLQFWAKSKRFVNLNDEVIAIEGVFEREGATLEDGSIGTRIVRFSEMEDMPTSEEVFQEVSTERMMGNNVDIMYLDPQKVRELDLYVSIQANPSDRLTPQLERAMQLEFFDRFNGDPMIDQEALRRETLTTLKKNPGDYMQAQPQQPMEPGPRLETQNPGNITSQMAAMAQPQIQDLIQQ